MRVKNKIKALHQELALTAIEKSGFNWFKMTISFFFFFFLSHKVRINSLVHFLRNSFPLGSAECFFKYFETYCFKILGTPSAVGKSPVTLVRCQGGVREQLHYTSRKKISPVWLNTAFFEECVLLSYFDVAPWNIMFLELSKISESAHSSCFPSATRPPLSWL